MRIDLYLVLNMKFESRNKAAQAIKAHSILVNGNVCDKPSYDVSDTDVVEVAFDALKYVSRGGYKLAGALEKFRIDFSGKTILDIGSSTGGFTDCALQNGAKKVYAVDVGCDQMHPTLRNDPRVVLYENTNILDFNSPIRFDYLVMDVSFVSIEHVIPGILKHLDDNNSLICLIKPQFEVGKMVGKGVIKDKSIHLKVLNQVSDFLEGVGLYINKLAPSPIKGGSGNIEFISVISKRKTLKLNYRSIVQEAHRG
jgi:23S rRNA (cytidine1920-2'-O)/16S rRNA (cytidine1409-2'-O)-methyltransferase